MKKNTFDTPGYGYFEPEFESASNPVHIHKETRNAASEVIPHWHNSLEFLYIKLGHPVITVGNTTFTADEDMIIQINTEEIHRVTFENGVSEFYCLTLALDYAAELGFPVGEISLPNSTKDPETAKIFDELIEEYTGQKRYRIAALKCLAVKFLLHIYRSCEFTSEIFPQKKMTPSVSITKNAIKYIKENYSSPISTETVAKATGVSLYHLCRCFKEVTGMTVVHYINFIRCTAAKTMLMKGMFTVSEAARECGFSGLSYFTKTYSSFIGCTPSRTLKSEIKERKRAKSVKEKALQSDSSGLSENPPA